MSAKLNVGILQYNVAWLSISENLKKAGNLIKCLPDSTDLILLPEMFATGFTMEPESISHRDHESVINWMQEISLKNNVAIAGSHPFKIHGRFYNRLLFFSQETEPDIYYDKRHLFSIGDEDDHYSPGIKRKIIHFHDWKLMPMICYDLRFPVWSRNDLSYDLLFYSSNWPASRNDVWETLLKARAIENQSYVVGVNRIGTDGLNISYVGNSQFISPKGNIMSKLGNETNYLFAELDRDKLMDFRTKFPVLNDRDRFEIK